LLASSAKNLTRNTDLDLSSWFFVIDKQVSRLDVLFVHKAAARKIITTNINQNVNGGKDSPPRKDINEELKVIADQSFSDLYAVCCSAFANVI
jgi:hypothetical protein